MENPAEERAEERVKRVMRAILASVPDGVVGVYHATIYARAAIEALEQENVVPPDHRR